jgi:pimeloyl-ACP methyl ester carboxylesterase
MAYADNRGVRIHYRVEGSGPPLVLQHGFTSSIEDWYEAGYVDALERDYRLILVDARGHGDSDKPQDAEAYPLEKRVGDVVAVLDALKIEKAHFWGYSAGGWIGFGMAEFAPKPVH